MKRNSRTPKNRFQAQSFQTEEDEAPEFEESDATPVTRAARKEAVAAAFKKLWNGLFTSPVHLDSALSKLPRHLKSPLAQIVPAILLKPVSQAQALGIGIAPDEPWSLTPEKLANWRPAELMSERLHEALTSRPSMPQAIAEDFPPAFRKECERDWGNEAAEELVAALSSPPPLSLRAARSVGQAKLKAALDAGGKLPVRAELSMLSPLAVRLAGYAPVLGTESYERGDFEIQDEGSQVMALFALWPELFGSLLSAEPGPFKPRADSIVVPPYPSQTWTVVDACAGAGGKTLALADALGGKSRVFAYDTSAKKLQALKRRASRAGLRNIKTVALEDGLERQALAKFAGSAHVVLVDAPCSGWGVLRRNPDIKWRQTPETLTRMQLLQTRLIQQYAPLVAPGGRLVFGVCTFRRAETLEVAERFLDQNREFDAGPGGFLGPHPCDGFFMQSFFKKR
jgi:16S rRNA C967 or C1407 C5-methylase (RsmB/RsmF family)